MTQFPQPFYHFFQEKSYVIAFKTFCIADGDSSKVLLPVLRQFFLEAMQHCSMENLAKCHEMQGELKQFPGGN